MEKCSSVGHLDDIGDVVTDEQFVRDVLKLRLQINEYRIGCSGGDFF